MSAQPNVDAIEQVKLAAEAFLYGYPLVYNLHEIAKFPAGTQSCRTNRASVQHLRLRAEAARSDTPILSHPTTTRCT